MRMHDFNLKMIEITSGRSFVNINEKLSLTQLIQLSRSVEQSNNLLRL